MFPIDELDVEDVLRRFTYKPNWTVRYLGGPGHLIEISAVVPDSRSVKILNTYMESKVQRPKITIQKQFAVPYFGTEDVDAFLFWLMNAIRHMEIHEMEEWAQLDGKLINDPHKEK